MIFGKDQDKGIRINELEPEIVSLDHVPPEDLLVPETAAPVVLDSKPTNGEKDIIIDAVIKVYFSEPIETASVNPSSFYLTDSLGVTVPGAIGFMVENTVAYLDPANLLAYSSEYTITVTTEVVDLQGLPLEKEYTATFSTRPEGSQGHIIRVPADTNSIQGGIDMAQDGDTVLVADGVYIENIRFRGKAITLASHYIMDGDTNHINNTIISGNEPSYPDSGSVVYFIAGEDTSSVLKGFTITGGTGTVWGENQHTGGGVFLWSGGKLESNKIINNRLTNGGNRYTHGAGIDLITERDAIVRDNLIAHNSIDAWWGGGAGVIMGCSDTASILFEKNILAENIYNADEGLCSGGAFITGLPGWGGRIIIRNNLVLRNEAVSTYAYNGLAGGFYIESASPEIYNNIIAGNTSTGRGGGINVGTDASNNPGNPIIINNTIAYNSARYGGGLYNWWSTNNPIVINNIMWGNQATYGNEIYLNGGTVTVVYSNIAGGYTGEGNISADPMFADTIEFRLTESSPCIGAGIDQFTSGSTTYYSPTPCFLGNPRPNPTGSDPDMGACESPLGSPVGNGIPPVVVSSKPCNGDQNVNVDVVIQVYFSEPIDPGSVNSNSFYLADSLGNHVLGTIGFLKGTKVAYLDPADSLEYSSAYTITVTTDVVDLQGQNLQETYTATFYTENPKPNWIVYNSFNSGLPDTPITCVAFDHNNNVWIGTWNGLVKFDGNNWTIYNTSNSGLPANEVTCITIDNNSICWIGTIGGLARYDENFWTIYNSTNSPLPENWIDCITIDDSNYVWLGAMGLVKFDGSNWTVYDQWNSGLPDSAIYAISIDYQNYKWIGTISGLTSFDGNNWMNYNSSNSGIVNNCIMAIETDIYNNKWIGAACGVPVGGLVMFDGNNWMVYNTTNSNIPGEIIGNIAIDNNNNKWCSVSIDFGTVVGLVKFDDSNWTVFDTGNSPLPSNNIGSISVDSRNNKWICTQFGLAVYNEVGIIFP